MITSQYSISFIISIIFFVLLLAVIFWKIDNHAPFVGVVTTYLILGMLLLTLYKSPSFSLDDTTIKRTRFFRRTIHSWDDVEEVYISKQETFPSFLSGWPSDAIKLVFKDDTCFIIWAGLYTNVAAMRAVITDKLNSRLHFVIPHHERKIQQTILYKKYAGNVFLSIRTMLIIAQPFIFMSIFEINGLSNQLWYIIFFLMMVMYIGFGFQMNYFEIQLEKLIIRNQYFPWRRKEYNLSDIEEVSREQGYRVANGLRIITYNYESKLYRAGSIGLLKWDDLFNDLASLGIKVSDRLG